MGRLCCVAGTRKQRLCLADASCAFEPPVAASVPRRGRHREHTGRGGGQPRAVKRGRLLLRRPAADWRARVQRALKRAALRRRARPVKTRRCWMKSVHLRSMALVLSISTSRACPTLARHLASRIIFRPSQYGLVLSATFETPGGASMQPRLHTQVSLVASPQKGLCASCFAFGGGEWSLSGSRSAASESAMAPAPCWQPRRPGGCAHCGGAGASSPGAPLGRHSSGRCCEGLGPRGRPGACRLRARVCARHSGPGGVCGAGGVSRWPCLGALRLVDRVLARVHTRKGRGMCLLGRSDRG